MKRFFALIVFSALIMSAAAGESYNFFFISDTHFGDEESFEMDQSVKWHFPAKGNPKRSALCMPKYEAIMAQIRQKSDASTFALVHSGDFLDGFAKTPELHAGQFRKYTAYLKEKSGIKVLIVNGNHDMLGKDGAKVYAQEMNSFNASQLGKPVDSTSNFTVWRGDDCFIFSDYYGAPSKHNSDYIVNTLKKLDKKPRYLFVIIHPNILPFPEKHLGILREVLTKHNAIVLCGHTHATNLLEYQNDGGTLTQFTTSALLSPNSAQDYKKISTDKEKYFAQIAKNWFYTTKDKQGKLRHDFTKEFAEPIAPKITRYWSASGCGFAEIKVSDSGVEALVYSANPSKKALSVKLR